MARKLSDWLENYAIYTQRTEPPSIYHAWTGVSCIASVLTRNAWLDWDTRQYPNHFILLVGPAACRKGTALRLGKDILRNSGTAYIACDRTSPESFIQEMLSREQPPVIPYPMSRTNSICPITVFSEEFVTFCRYDNSSFLQDLCDLYDSGDVWKYGTIKRGIEEVEGVCLNLIGAITPKLIRVAFPPEAIGGGLTSRMILVYAGQKRAAVTRAVRTAAELRLRDDLTEDLRHISTIAGAFQPDSDWLALYDDWYLEQERVCPIEDENFENYIGRRQMHMIKLSMVFSASRDDNMILDREVFERAHLLLTATERHMPQCFAGMGRVAYAEVLPKVLDFLRRVVDCPYSAICGEFRQDLSPADADSVLTSLAGANAIRIYLKGGRKWVEYTPNAYQAARAASGQALAVPGAAPAPPVAGGVVIPYGKSCASPGAGEQAPGSESSPAESPPA